MRDAVNEGALSECRLLLVGMGKDGRLWGRMKLFFRTFFRMVCRACVFNEIQRAHALPEAIFPKTDSSELH